MTTSNQDEPTYSKPLRRKTIGLSRAVEDANDDTIAQAKGKLK